MISKEQSVRISNMGFLAAAMVVGIHVKGDVSPDHPLWLWTQWGRLGIFRLAVPFFFLVSGFMLAGHFHEKGWWHCECRKRIKSLFVPFVLWCSVYVVTWCLAIILGNLFHGQRVFERMPAMMWWLKAYGLNPFCFPLLGPLWYVRTLLIFVLISPLIGVVLRSFGWKFVLGLYVFSGVNTYLASGHWQLFSTHTFPLGSLTFFTLGALIRLNDWTTVARDKILPVVALAIGLFLIALDIHFISECSVDNLDVGFRMVYVPLLIFAVYNLMPPVPLPGWMTASAFPIFLMHVLVWLWLRLLFGRVLEPILSPSSGITWIVKWLLGVCVPMGMTVLLRFFAPRVAKLLFGGR